MKASLLDEHSRSEFNSLDVHDKDGENGHSTMTKHSNGASSASSPAFMEKRTTIPAFVLYSLIAFAGLMTVLTIVFMASWMAARSSSSGAVVPPPPFSSSAGSTSTPQQSSSTVLPQPSSSMGPNPPTSMPMSSRVAPSAPTLAPTSAQTGRVVPTSVQPPQPASNLTDAPNSLVPNTTMYPANTWPGAVKSYTLLHLLSGLYEVAMENGGNRAVGRAGFNASIEYLLYQIRTKTNLINIERTYFNPGAPVVTNTAFTASIPTSKSLMSYTYMNDYRLFGHSLPLSNATGHSLVFVDRGGCSWMDWEAATGPETPLDWFAITLRNASCTDNIRAGFAVAFRAAGLILQMLPGSNAAPATGVVPYGAPLTALSMNSTKAQALIDAVKYGGTSAVSIFLNADLSYPVASVTTNICGETPTGDRTSMVLVGGHSDGVAAGPGTNDDGSGSIATLTLAIALTKLTTNPAMNYPPLVNAVKFCWFGAEELGLLGSAEAVRQAVLNDNKPAARVGSRARDWAIMVDLDMLGSLNFVNYVYDAMAYIPPTTPTVAHNGSKLLSGMFFDFFDSNNLPRNSETFDGRSDYVRHHSSAHSQPPRYNSRLPLSRSLTVALCPRSSVPGPVPRRRQGQQQQHTHRWCLSLSVLCLSPTFPMAPLCCGCSQAFPQAECTPAPISGRRRPTASATSRPRAGEASPVRSTTSATTAPATTSATSTGACTPTRRSRRPTCSRSSRSCPTCAPTWATPWAWSARPAPTTCCPSSTASARRSACPRTSGRSWTSGEREDTGRLEMSLSSVGERAWGAWSGSGQSV